jgi:hypothetical protein
MAQELLHRADVVTRLKQMRGKAVAQGVAGLAMPASRNARFMPRCNPFSSPWRRRMTLDADQ